MQRETEAEREKAHRQPEREHFVVSPQGGEMESEVCFPSVQWLAGDTGQAEQPGMKSHRAESLGGMPGAGVGRELIGTGRWPRPCRVSGHRKWAKRRACAGHGP